MNSLPANPAYLGRTKYTEKAATDYQHRPHRKHLAEMKLVERAFAEISPGSVLDVPCGGGRMSVLLAAQGHQVTAADLSPAMQRIARDRLSHLRIPVDAQDVEKLSYGTGAFDAVLCFRLFQHFPQRELRARVIHELCRVSRSHVVLSYFSVWSWTALKRRFRQFAQGWQPDKFHTTLAEVRGYFREVGFELTADHAQWRGIHSLHTAVFAYRPAARFMQTAVDGSD